MIHKFIFQFNERLILKIVHGFQSPMKIRIVKLWEVQVVPEVLPSGALVLLGKEMEAENLEVLHQLQKSNFCCNHNNRGIKKAKSRQNYLHERKTIT